MKALLTRRKVKNVMNGKISNYEKVENNEGNNIC